MNWLRGMFRLWLVATFVWLPVAGYFLVDDFVAVHQAPTPGLNVYNCLATNTCPPWITEPDLDTRRRALITLIVPPIVAPIVCFAVFWAGWVGFRIAAWVGRGFRISD
jgi:hypothetical protein